MPDDTSILKCTIKKSASVSAILILIASCVVCGYYLLNIVFKAFVQAAPTIKNIITGIIDFIILTVMLIPWYVYCIVLIAICILVYSYLCCYSRRFTEEDWDAFCWYTPSEGIIGYLVLLVIVPLAMAGFVLSRLEMAFLKIEDPKKSRMYRVIAFYHACKRYKARICDHPIPDNRDEI